MALRAGQSFERTLGPFVGVHDSPDPGASQPTRLFDALNVLVPDVANGSPVLARHGMMGVTAQMGDASNRTGQGFFTHRRTDGTIDRFTFDGGRMYRWDGASTFTECSPAGIAIDTTNPIFCATMKDEVVISDEVNDPWIFTPGADTGEKIKYDDAGTAWCTKGGPTIRSGKVVFVVRVVGDATLTTEDDVTLTTEDDVDLDTEPLSGVQNTIVWSEEGDPRTGYEQGNFDNAITLIQTSDEVLGCIVGEEGSMIYFRNKGIGQINGDIAVDFKASNTKDTISTESGTDCPAGVVLIGRKVWYLDMDGRVKRLTMGGGEPESLWFPMRREIQERLGTAANRANVVAHGRGVYHEEYSLVLFTIWDRQTIYAFDAESGRFVGAWSVGGDVGSGIHIDAMGSTVDAQNRATFVILGTRSSTYSTAGQGVLWRQKHADDVNQWLDQADASIATYIPLVRAAESHFIAETAASEFHATAVQLQLAGDTARHDVALQYITPSAGVSSKLTAKSTATLGEKSATDSTSSARYSLGRNAQGTAIRLRVSATHADNVRWGLHRITFQATVTKARPGSK